LQPSIQRYWPLGCAYRCTHYFPSSLTLCRDFFPPIYSAVFTTSVWDQRDTVVLTRRLLSSPLSGMLCFKSKTYIFSVNLGYSIITWQDNFWPRSQVSSVSIL
jgi:hypothetical protein